jgi:hypothetical protein
LIDAIALLPEREPLPMKKLNTHEIYVLATQVHPLTEIKYVAGTTNTIGDVAYPIFKALFSIARQVNIQGSFFSPSIKRSAGELTRAIYELGIKKDFWETDAKTPIQEYPYNSIATKAKDFETVLANEMPGLAIYSVIQKGIYATEDLISQAELQIPEGLRKRLSEKARDDLRESGKCLAYEVSTASAFHMWRAVETVMGQYYKFLSGGKSFEEDGVTNRNWGQYIKALNGKGANNKITTFLDHIRDEYRNPVSHPEESIELDEAFGLFNVGLGAITQMLREIPEPSQNSLSHLQQAISKVIP